MRVIIDAKTGKITKEEYTPPIPTEEEQRQQRINEILYELIELDSKIKRVDEDILEQLNKLTGYVPYSTTVEVINHKEDLRDELKLLKKQEVQNESED